MAGGEGSRLRPLTSNQQKAMLPMANRPMMEHIVRLLRQHGFDDLVVTVAFMANHVRTYFGDGSEFGVRMVYATEETPLGTAGSVRNARAELDERFLVIAGDVLTDMDISAVVRFHEERGALATITLKAMENPLEFGIVITREDGSIERFLEKPTGGRSSATPSTPASTCSSPRSSTTSRRVWSTSPETCSRPCWTRASPSTGPWPKAPGRTWAPWRPTPGPTRTSSTARSASRFPASGSGRACGWGRGPRSIPTPSWTAPPSWATTAGSTPAPTSPSTPSWGPTCGWGWTPTSSAPSCTTTPTSGPR